MAGPGPARVVVWGRRAGAAEAHRGFRAVTGRARVPEAWLFGSAGTLHRDGATGAWVLRGGKPGDKELAEIEVPADKQGGWRVEEEFINAIRGKELVTHTSFGDGVKYMEFTKAVTRSAESGKAVALPL